MQEENNKRSPYQEEMDQIHIPKEKADETLRLMLEENRKLREHDAQKASGHLRRSTWLIPAAYAVAACLILVFSGVLRQDRVTFGSVSIPATARSGPAGASTETPESVRMAAESLLPSWNVSEKEGNLFLLEKDGIRLHAMFFEPDSEDVREMMELPASGKPAVRFIRDPDTGSLGALFEKGEMLVLLFARNMEENDFIRIVREAAGS